jgi:hypothetical protein
VGCEPIEAAVICHEIFATQAYSRHGIALRNGALVYDVGANMGLYRARLHHDPNGCASLKHGRFLNGF